MGLVPPAKWMSYSFAGAKFEACDDAEPRPSPRRS